MWKYSLFLTSSSYAQGDVAEPLGHVTNCLPVSFLQRCPGDETHRTNGDAASRQTGRHLPRPRDTAESAVPHHAARGGPRRPAPRPGRLPRPPRPRPQPREDASRPRGPAAAAAEAQERGRVAVQRVAGAGEPERLPRAAGHVRGEVLPRAHW